MRSLLVCLLLIPLAFAPKPFRKHREDGTDPITCLKCEGVVEVFHFLNDAIIGGAGEEELKEEVLGLLCGDPPIDQTFCDEVRNGPLWDTIFKALRDSLGAFYTLIGVQVLDCPELKIIQSDCEF